MSHPDLILTLTGGLFFALILGYCTHRLGLSPIVGYLLAGIVVGPHTPGYVADETLAEEMAHIGIILLMFGVGLHFHLEQLMAVRKIAIPGALYQSLATTLLSTFLLMRIGWTWQGGLVFGLAISIASTVVLLRVLGDNKLLHSPTGHLAIGWLIVEDLLTVLILVFLPIFFGGEQASLWTTFLNLLWSILKIGLLVVFVMVAGGKLIPMILEKVAQAQSRELFTMTIVVIALGIAVGSARLFGASMELGAFLAGMVVGKSDFSSRAAAEALPLRDAFAVLFFVSIGMLFNPAHILDNPELILLTIITVLLAKPIIGFVILRIKGCSNGTGLRVSLLLGQIGEFSFILANLGKSLKILPEEGMNALVATAIITISLNPLLFRGFNLLATWFRRNPTLSTLFPRKTNSVSADLFLKEKPLSDLHRVIVVGYGPIGQTLVRLLLHNNFSPTILDLNLETVRKLKDLGLNAVYGDALNPQTLEQAGCMSAIALILSSAATDVNGDIIRLAKGSNPSLRIFARAEFLKEIDHLRKAGADVVFTSEGEVALGMTTFLLRQMGATDEQIDQEVEQVRHQFFFQNSFHKSRSLGTLLSIDPARKQV